MSRPRVGGRRLLLIALALVTGCAGRTDGSAVKSPAGATSSNRAAAGPAAPSETLAADDGCLHAGERPVRFPAQDGSPLTGVLVGQGTMAVIAAHMVTSDVCEWLPFARRLAAHRGVLVLAYDTRGDGVSPSGPDISRVDLDMPGAVAFLRGHGVTRIVLAGASAGATDALVAAATVSPPVDGVVALSPATVVGPQADAVVVAPRLTVPTLIMAAASDASSPEDARTIFAAVTSRDKRLSIVPGGSHGTHLLDDPTYGHVYADRVEAWILGHLAARR